MRRMMMEGHDGTHEEGQLSEGGNERGSKRSREEAWREHPVCQIVCIAECVLCVRVVLGGR